MKAIEAIRQIESNQYTATSLNISYNRISNDHLSRLVLALNHSPHVNSLKLASCNLDSASAKILLGLKNIKKLDLSCNAGIRSSILELAQIEGLHELTLHEIGLYNTNGIAERLLSTPSSLRRLDISGNGALDDDLIALDKVVLAPNIQSLVLDSEINAAQHLKNLLSQVEVKPETQLVPYAYFKSAFFTVNKVSVESELESEYAVVNTDVPTEQKRGCMIQ